MLLHARRLAFVHPGSGARVEVHAPLDAEFARALALFADEPALQAWRAITDVPLNRGVPVAAVP